MKTMRPASLKSENTEVLLNLLKHFTLAKKVFSQLLPIEAELTDILFNQPTSFPELLFHWAISGLSYQSTDLTLLHSFYPMTNILWLLTGKIG